MQENLLFLHTADWQLGKAFASGGNDVKRFRLQQQLAPNFHLLLKSVPVILDPIIFSSLVERNQITIT
jgi:hypothetical protein